MNEALSRRFNRLFWQTVLSVVLFLVVFVGEGLLPGQDGGVYETVNRWLTHQESLTESVETLGKTVSEGRDWMDAMWDWCQETFFPVQLTSESSEELIARGNEYHSYLLPTVSAPDAG